MLDAEPEVGDGARQVLLHQDVLRLEVAVRDAGLACEVVELGFVMDLKLPLCITNKVTRPLSSGGWPTHHASQ